jgi:REP element-mobilizing transposase RayT
LSLTHISTSRSLSTVPRQPRIEYEGAIYHVINREDRREDIVDGDADRGLFVLTLGETYEKCGWEVHAWCLMQNHFHLAVETPLGNLVSGMKWFLGAYTIRYNARHRLRGHLFAGRYKSLIVGDWDPPISQCRRYCVSGFLCLNPPTTDLCGFIDSSNGVGRITEFEF